jgi:hypothetical protein
MFPLTVWPKPIGVREQSGPVPDWVIGMVKPSPNTVPTIKNAPRPAVLLFGCTVKFND